MTVIPPWPWGPWSETAEKTKYRAALLNRFSATAFDVKEAARAAAVDATASADAIKASLTGLPPTDPSRPELEKRESDLRRAASHAESVVTRWDGETRPAEDSCSFVDRALDLQVAKAGGLLAFNGLVTAVGLLLWTSREPLPRFSSVGNWLFVSLLVSSLLSLVALLSWWAPPDTYGTPARSLDTSIKLAAARAWAANLATGAAIVATGIVALWVWQSTPVTTKLEPHSHADAPAAFGPADTLWLRCVEIERPSTRRGGLPPGDDLTCSLAR